MGSLDEYRALVAKIDGFVGRVGEARRADMACRAGCDACCHVSLEVSAVEAAAIRAYLDTLSLEERAAIARRSEGASAQEEARCVMLDEAGRCSIYPARPLVCRTQGLPLRYPEGLIPISAVMARGAGGQGAITWCPLNFTERAPSRDDVLDAERVDQLLALVNRRYCEGANVDNSIARTGLRELAAETATSSGGRRTSR